MFGVPSLYIFGGLGIALLLTVGVEEFRINSYRVKAAEAEVHAQDGVVAAAKVNEIFARLEVMRESDRAEQAKKNADEILRLRDERDAIETRFKNVSADREKISAENRRFRDNAPKTDSRLVGPTMVRVINCLRQQQQDIRANRPATPCKAE